MTQAQKHFNKLNFEYHEYKYLEEFVNFELGMEITFYKDTRQINISTFGRTDNIPYNLMIEIIKITELRKRELEW